MPTEFAEMAVRNLRDTTNFGWYVIPLLFLVMHLYVEEIQRKNFGLELKN